MAGYLAVLATFRNTAEKKEKEIRKYYDESDWDNFTVKVHALKSSARIIGAMELAALAERLENAGKEKDTDLIGKKIAERLQMYDGTVKVLAAPGNI